MYIHKLANAAASKPVVTSTATLLLDLITTAGSAAHGVPGTANAVDIVPEDGDVRLLMDGNTPTASNGLLLKSGVVHSFRNIPLTKIRLIRTGSADVNCSVQIGQSDVSETTSYGGSSNASSNVVYSSSASNTPSIASAATALAANSARKYFMITNLGTNPLFVRFGASASTTVFHVCLAAGNVNDDGLGASYESGVWCYTGEVSIAGTSPRYTVFEAAP